MPDNTVEWEIIALESCLRFDLMVQCASDYGLEWIKSRDNFTGWF